jgi:hypothetical protein
MKLAITIELDVDTTAWGDEYYIYATKNGELKQDVCNYIQNLVTDSAAATDANAFHAVRITKVVERKS